MTLIRTEEDMYSKQQVTCLLRADQRKAPPYVGSNTPPEDRGQGSITLLRFQDRILRRHEAHVYKRGDCIVGVTNKQKNAM